MSSLSGIAMGVTTAGCSDEAAPAEGSGDGGFEARGPRPPRPDAEDDPEPVSCRSDDPIDATKLPYKKARVVPGACTPEEADKLAEHASSVEGNISIADWRAEVSERCASCVFSDGSEDTWTPIITNGDAISIYNRGGCLEVLSGSEACGAAYHRIRQCIVDACRNCKTQIAFTACRRDLRALAAGACADAFDTVNAACDQAVFAEQERACNFGDWVFNGAIKYMCVEAPDGGVDGGDGGSDDGDG